MTFLPIVARELRVAARRPGSYWNRLAAATLALVVGTLVYANFNAPNFTDLGLTLFAALAGLAFVFCALAGARLTADTISEERREGTLGLLFLTDLKGYDIVLGKLAASSLNGVYSLLAIVPILGLAVLFGGVSGRQFGLTVLVLLNTLFCSLAVGSWVSTWFENGRRAVLVSALLMLGLCLGPWFALWLLVLRDGFGSGPPDFTVVVPSPVLALIIALLPANAMPPGVFGPIAQMFWPSVGTVCGLGVLCLTLSSFAVPRVWRDRPAGSWRERLRHQWDRLKFGAGPARAALRARMLARNPIFWLHARERFKPLLVWLALAGGGAFLAWLRHLAPDDWHDPGLLLSFSQGLYGVLKLWIAAAVVVRLAEDRRSGALELLLTVPLTLRDVSQGLRHALQRQFLGPLLAVLLADGWFCALHLRRDYSAQDLVLALYAARLSLLVLDVVTLWQLGPWVAVTARHPNQAAANLLVRVCVLPWLVWLGGVIALALLGTWKIWEPDLSEWHALGAWFGLGLLNDVFWLAWARRQTLRHFREAAAARFTGRRGWWRGLWRLN